MILPATLVGGAMIGAGIFCRAVFSARSQICGPVIWRGSTDAPPRIALTFDDGPHPVGTPAILDILREFDAPATFFVIGNRVREHASVVQRMVVEGHLIGNHSFGHAKYGTMRRRQYWRGEISRTDDAIRDITGRRPAYFRPPMGFRTFHVTRAARENTKTMVNWTRRGLDGMSTSSERIVARLGQSTQGGDIICLHDGVAPGYVRDVQDTIDALPRLINIWRDRGLAVVPLDQLLGGDGYCED